MKCPSTYLQRLAACWEDANKIHAANKCPQHKLPKKRPTTQCAFIGFCVCSNWRLRRFVVKLAQYLRTVLPAKTSNRALLAASRIVVHISSNSTAHDWWLHIAYVNCVTFAGGLIPLVNTADAFRQITASAAGRVALDLAQPYDKRLGVNHWWHFCRGMDFDLPWHVRVCALRDDLGTNFKDFVPAEVEVRGIYPTAERLLWSGGDERPPKKKRSDGPRFDKGRKRPKKPRDEQATPSPEQEESEEEPPPAGAPVTPCGSARQFSSSSDESGEGFGSEVESDASWLRRANRELESDGDTPKQSSSEDLCGGMKCTGRCPHI